MDYGRQGNDYYGRQRSSSPRDRFRRDGSRGGDGYGRRDQDWSRGSDRHEYDRREPERYSSSWRRDSLDRSPRGRYRSRSRSHGRHRSRDSSRSPKRRSSRRSSSYGSRKRFRRGSSSSSRSSSDSRSRSHSPEERHGPKEDIFKSMYADREEQVQPAAYLHPALSRSAVTVSTNQTMHVASTHGTEAVAAQAVSNTAGFAALSQAYGGNSPKKSYAQNDVDDEDRFLYGEEAAAANVEKPLPAQVGPRRVPQPSNPAPAQNAAVTPGGFDSNALKNVLKAIGFDFEMSAQQSQTGPQPPKEESPPKPAPPPQPAPLPAEAPQRIQTIGTGNAAKPVQPQPTTQQSYYQPYDPYNPDSTVYPAAAVQHPVETPPTHLGYPITIQDPNNPGNTLIVYRPANPPTQPQLLYQHPPQPQAVVAPQGGRVVLPPQRQESVPEVEKTEKEIRQERLDYLQEELEKLKKQQNELLRKKRREKDGHKDPLIKKNTMLQAGVEEQIREIKQAAERAAGIESGSSDDEVQQKEEKEDRYVYFDPGNHWCRLCNVFSEDLSAFLSHLHSKTHRKAIDPYDRPWDESEKTKKQKSADSRTKALKGSEFLIPITGYYCKLCLTFSGDQMCADDHLKSRAHNAMYKKHCKKNPSYEKKYKKKKKVAMETSTNGERKKEAKKVVMETEVKFVPTPVKQEEIQSRFMKEEQKYVEEEPPKKYPEAEVKYIESPRKYSDCQDDYYQQPSHKSEKREKQHKRLSRERSNEMDHEPARRAYDREDQSFPQNQDERKSLRKFPDDYAEHQRHSSERGHRKKGWSPGYDEYERQQQDDRYEGRDKRRSDERKSRRSNSREKWVEKPAHDFKMSSDSSKSSKESIAAGAKIPTPGFGKFSWNSGASRDSRRFDQVPVDNLVPSRETIDNKNGEFSAKGKIAIKITGKTQYPPRLSTSNSLSKSNSNSGSEVTPQEKKMNATTELQRKVEALKRENALRNQLSSIALPSGRGAKQPPKPNTAAVMLGTRSIGKHNTLLLAKKNAKRGKKDEEEIITHDIEVDVSPPPPPERPHQPPPPGVFEPPPPGEEEGPMGGIDNDGANSEASGISMELASDED